jgi:uncharacterized protein (TIGR00299 family) protein
MTGGKKHDHDHAHGHHHVHAGDQVHADRGRSQLQRDAGVGRILYLDASSGLAGDKLVAALLDLGVPEQVLREALAGVAIGGYSLRILRVTRSGIAATQFLVDVDDAQPARSYREIVGLLRAASTLGEGARALALRAFEILANAEAEVHACAVEDVHFHEVGAIDSIVDIVAAAVGFDHLGARVRCSPLPMGRGSIRSAHGVIPLPAPATVLCLAGMPTYDAGLAAELVTPTGACLVAAVCQSFGDWPSFRPERVGMSAGTKQWPDRPNLLRIVLGEAEPAGHRLTRSVGSHVVLEANIDDMTPELAAFAVQQLLEAGALDAWTTPAGMKKGRPGFTLSALCEQGQLETLARVLLSETTTLGLRHYPVDRLERSRRMVQVETEYGPIDVKVAGGDGLAEHAAPEYETCRRAAQAHGVPARRVYTAAIAAFEALRNKS